jgi:glyoxalase family protein
MQLHGIHHLTAITSDAKANHHFYTQVMGLRLVKKTVNQDDPSAYHLFYADAEGRPGTDLTFFEWPVPPERRGTNAITRTGFRVRDAASLAYWHARFEALGVRCGVIEQQDGRACLAFEDHEGQRLMLVASGENDARPYAASPVPPEHQIIGLGPIEVSVPVLAPTAAILTKLYAMREARHYTRGGAAVHVFEMGPGGPGAEVHVAVEPHLPRAREGAGGVHHIAFRVADMAEYEAWVARYNALRLPSSGPVDRFWFRSLYLREPNGILLELATDGPGFGVDEPLAHLGETLILPPFLEARRSAIQAGLTPL